MENSLEKAKCLIESNQEIVAPNENLDAESARFWRHAKDIKKDKNFLVAKVASEGRTNYLPKFLEALYHLKKCCNLFQPFPASTDHEILSNLLRNLHDSAAKSAATIFHKALEDLRVHVDSMSLIDELGMLISPEKMTLLHSQLDILMIGGINQSLCLLIYSCARRTALYNIIVHMENEKIKGKSTKDMIPERIELMQISVKFLFAGERKLCGQVLKGFENALLEECFLEVTSRSLARLLNLWTEVPSMEMSSADFFLLYDAYDMMRELELEMEKMAASKKQSTAFQTMMMLRDWLGVTAAELFLGFSKEVENKRSMPTEDGGIHDFSFQVKENLKVFIGYQDNLRKLLQQYKSGEDGLQFAPSCLQIMQAYQRKLEALTKDYKDPSQSYLFLMNNIHYMATSLKGIEGATELLGDDWISKQLRAADVYAELYRIMSWAQVFERISGDLTVTTKKDAVKKRFKNFNKLLEEQLRKQRQWKVNDIELRRNLRTSVAAILVSAYGLFYEQFRPILEKCTSSCMKYTPEEVEKMVLEGLFDKTETPG